MPLNSQITDIHKEPVPLHGCMAWHIWRQLLLQSFNFAPVLYTECALIIHAMSPVATCQLHTCISLSSLFFSASSQYKISRIEQIVTLMR